METSKERADRLFNESVDKLINKEIESVRDKIKSNDSSKSISNIIERLKILINLAPQ